MSLVGKHILLGISGGIAAYKGAELVRHLRRRGAQVRVVLTAAGAHFITPLTLQALSGQPVHQHLLEAESEAAMGHIELARWADAVLVAPASADLLARLAHGLADDLLTTLCLATEAPIVLAPAMNRVMWASPATRTNAELLSSRGTRLWGPASGEQACGEVGEGRMLEAQEIAERLQAMWDTPPSTNGCLRGKKVLITAGPTREAIDPVRYLCNRSSGKMGFALAEAAACVGADATLVAGPVALATPAGVERVDVTSAAQMHAAVLARAADCELFIACAAVADYRPEVRAEQKIKKDKGPLTLTLVPTTDILAEVAALGRPPFTVGFAAETQGLRANALKKLRTKGLDMVAGNRVDLPGIGFETDENALEVYWNGGERVLQRAPKKALAMRVIELIGERLRATAG